MTISCPNQHVYASQIFPFPSNESQFPCGYIVSNLCHSMVFVDFFGTCALSANFHVLGILAKNITFNDANKALDGIINTKCQPSSLFQRVVYHVRITLALHLMVCPVLFYNSSFYILYMLWSKMKNSWCYYNMIVFACWFPLRRFMKGAQHMRE